MPQPATVPDQRLLGILTRAASAVLFAFMGALLKLASARGVSAMEMIFYRSAAALPVVAGWVVAVPGLRAVRTRQPLAHLWRSALGLGSMLLLFEALGLLPLAVATTLTYSAPILATVLSAVVLGEAVGPRRWAAVVVGFVGVVLVAAPWSGGGTLPALGLLFALGASLGQSAVIITLRQIGRTEGTAAIVFWFTLVTTVAGAVLLVPFGRGHDGWTYALLVAAGVCAGGGQLCTTAALRFAPVAVVVPFDYLQIIVATLLGWLLFASLPGPVMLAGAALIAGSGVYTALRERRRGQLPGLALAGSEA